MTNKEPITFKVWLEIERYNEKTETGQDMDAPASSLATFETYREARDYAKCVMLLAENIVSPTAKLLAACRMVVERWESGNLAEAARMCQAAIDEMERR
jgi:hypothetical protein